MYVLHLQRQGVCVLLPSGHHLDQHTRVSVILQTSTVCIIIILKVTVAYIVSCYDDCSLGQNHPVVLNHRPFDFQLQSWKAFTRYAV